MSFDQEYMSVTQAAQKTGLHNNTVYNMVKRGELPHERYGNRVVLRADDVACIEVIEQPGMRNIVRYNPELKAKT